MSAIIRQCTGECMRFFKATIFLALASSLTACSLTLPVKGIVQDSDERFSGIATGYMDGSGDLKIVSNKGASCEGNFVYVTRRNGEGVFDCSDGRSGPFKFVSAGDRGTGYGTLGKQNFTFTFGN